MTPASTSGDFLPPSLKRWFRPATNDAAGGGVGACNGGGPGEGEGDGFTGGGGGGNGGGRGNGDGGGNGGGGDGVGSDGGGWGEDSMVGSCGPMRCVVGGGVAKFNGVDGTLNMELPENGFAMPSPKKVWVTIPPMVMPISGRETAPQWVQILLLGAPCFFRVPLDLRFAGR